MLKDFCFTEQKIVSFDFDHTLYDTFISFPRWEILNYLKLLSQTGNKIIIVTARQNEERFEVERFIQKHKLPVKDIYFTNQGLKGPILKDLGVLKHIDDCPFQLQSAIDYGIEAINLYGLINV